MTKKEKQLNALELAAILELPEWRSPRGELKQAAAELRRLHRENEALRSDAECYRSMKIKRVHATKKINQD